jgi:nitrite reductase (NADH) large subunit
MPELVIIGAGAAAYHLCQALVARRLTATWRVTVLGEEGRVPYAREALPEVLGDGDGERLELAPRSWYDGHGIRLALDQPATSIDRGHRRVVTAGGDEIAYDRLVLATGASPYLPPIVGRDLPGVLCVRTIDDALAARDLAARAKRVAVLGGGPLGLGLADRLRRRASVHLVELAAGLCLRQLDLVSSGILRSRAEGAGITVHTGRQVLAIVPGRSELGVHGADGTRLGAELVVLACGARPRDELAAGSGLRRGLRGGIVVDARLRSDDPLISALGACAVRGGRVHDDDDAIAAQAATIADELGDGPGPEWEPLPAVTRMAVDGVEAWSFGEVHGSELDRRVVWELPGETRRMLVLRGSQPVGACGVGDWPEASRIARSIAGQSRLWLWQLARFRRTGRLWSGAAPAMREAHRAAERGGFRHLGRAG